MALFYSASIGIKLGWQTLTNWRSFWEHINRQMIVNHVEIPQQEQNQVFPLDRLVNPALLQMANLQNMANQGMQIEQNGLQLVRRRGRVHNPPE